MLDEDSRYAESYVGYMCEQQMVSVKMMWFAFYACKPENRL